MPLFEFLNKLLGQNTIILKTFSFILIIIEALWLNNIVYKYQLVKKETFLPALFYVVLASSLREMLIFNAAIISNFFIIYAFKEILLMYDENATDRKTFNASLLISISSLFYFPSIILVLLIFISFIIFRIFSFRRWIIVLIGFLTPYLYIITYYYIYDKLNFFIHNKILMNMQIGYYNIFPIKNNITIAILSIIILLFLISFLNFIKKISDGVIRIREYKLVAVWFILLSLSTFLILSTDKIMLLYMTILPLTIFMTDYFLSFKKQWFVETLFLLLILSIVYFRIYY
jgi:hypothetical protein